MKDSGVEWIGEIPEQWRLAKIGNFYQITLGKMLETKQPDDGYSLENYLCSANIKWKAVDTSINKKMWFSEAERIQYLLKEGDVLITEGGSAGTACLYNGEFSPCYIQNSVLRCSASEIDNKYLYYWMHVVYHGGYIDSICNRATIQHYTKDKLQHTPIICLPKEDKIRIIRYLDEKCTRIDGVIEKQQAAIEKLKEYKISFVTEAVTKGLNKNVPLIDSGTAWMGNVPVGWKKYRIANLYDHTAISGREDLPILTVSINSGISDSELDEAEQERHFVRSEDRTKYKRVRPGDLVYNMMRAWQGAFGAARVDGMVSPAYVTCRPKNNVQIDSRFIEYLFRTPIAIEEMHRYSHGVADFRLRLYWNEFRNIQVCLPDINEQRIIADYIDVMMKKIEYHIRERESIIAKLKLYRSSLIYEIVTGKKAVD